MQLNLTVSELITVLSDGQLVEGAHALDQSLLLKNIRAIDVAQETDLTLILPRGDASKFSEVARAIIEKTQAAVILAPRETVENSRDLFPDKNFVALPDVLSGYGRLLTNLVEKEEGEYRSRGNTVASTAHVSSSATLGYGVTIGEHAFIGANAVIESGVTIGAGSVIKPNVIIGRNCIIGDYTLIHSGTVVGSDGFGYEVTQNGLRKIPHVGIVHIGSHVEIGANVTIDRATFDKTVIANGVKIDNLVHVAHNVVIGPSSAILALTGIAGGAHIGAGCQIGGQVAIKDHVKIGNGVAVVSKAAVTKDIADGQTVAGVPAQPFKEWKRANAFWMILNSKRESISKLLKFAEGTGDAPAGMWKKIKSLF